MEYIRVSASYLFNIKIGESYLLVKSERRNQYQPVGGCYKYFREAEKFLSSIGVVPEKKSNGVDSLMDLRLVVPKDNLGAFIDWYKSGQNRETTYERELNEELVLAMPQEKQGLFEKIMAEKLASGSFKVFFDEEKGLQSIKPMDIVAIKLSPEQEKVVCKLCQNNPSFILAKEEDILNGYKTLSDSTKVKIGGHTKNILQNCDNSLEM